MCVDVCVMNEGKTGHGVQSFQVVVRPHCLLRASRVPWILPVVVVPQAGSMTRDNCTTVVGDEGIGVRPKRVLSSIYHGHVVDERGAYSMTGHRTSSWVGRILERFDGVSGCACCAVSNRSCYPRA